MFGHHTDLMWLLANEQKQIAFPNASSNTGWWFSCKVKTSRSCRASTKSHHGRHVGSFYLRTTTSGLISVEQHKVIGCRYRSSFRKGSTSTTSEWYWCTNIGPMYQHRTTDHPERQTEHDRPSVQPHSVYLCSYCKRTAEGTRQHPTASCTIEIQV